MSHSLLYAGDHLTLVIFYVVPWQQPSIVFPEEMLFSYKLESKRSEALV